MGHNSSAQPSGLGTHSRYPECRLKGGNNLKCSLPNSACAFRISYRAPSGR